MCNWGKNPRADPKEAGDIFTSCLAWKLLETALEELEDKDSGVGRPFILLTQTQKGNETGGIHLYLIIMCYNNDK